MAGDRYRQENRRADGAGYAGSVRVYRPERWGSGASVRRCRYGWLVALAMFSAGACAGTAQAASYEADDGVALEAAVAHADASSAPSTIVLTGGVFLPSLTLRIGGDVTIVGPSSGRGARIDGGAVEPFPSDLLLVEAHAKLTLWNVQLTTGGGGAFASALDDSGAVDVESSTIEGNDGPGLEVEPGGLATVRNSTLSDGSDFGLIDDGTASLFNSTIAFNTNGGIDNSDGVLNLTNTIVADNSPFNCTRHATTSDRSLDSDGSCGVGSLSNVNPLLDVDLRNNGGPTPTHALEAGSPAIGAGDESKCPPDDQRHFIRPSGSCDIGAYQADAVQSDAQQGPAGSGPAGPGSAGGSSGSGAVSLVVSGHGRLRGARGSRITFTLRAQVGRKSATFRYVDSAHHVVLGALTVTSLSIDRSRGVATLVGSGVEKANRRRVRIRVVLESRAGHPTLSIRLSNGYHESGRLLSGSVTFTKLSPSREQPTNHFQVVNNPRSPASLLVERTTDEPQGS
jgi:hypothetical protein